MPRLPILSGRVIVDLLEKKFGFQLVSQRGSHMKLRKEMGEKTVTTIVPNHTEVARGTLEGILELANISKDEFLDKYER